MQKKGSATMDHRDIDIEAHIRAAHELRNATMAKLVRAGWREFMRLLAAVCLWLAREFATGTAKSMA